MQLYQDTIQDRNGNVISSAVVTITDYPGGASSTVYATDAVGANINPITANSDGQYEFYAVPGVYTLTVTKSGVTTESKVVTLGAAGTSFLQSGTGAVSRSVQSKERDIVSVFDFMTAAQIADVQAETGSIDTYAAFQAAVDYLQTFVLGGTLLIPRGSYKISGGTVTNDRSSNYLIGRVSFKGEDEFGVRITYSGAGAACFSVSAAQSGGSEPNASYQEFSGMTILGPTKRAGSAGILVNLGAFCKFRNLEIQAFDYGIYGQDIDQFLFEKCNLRFNKKGLFSTQNAIPGAASTRPNDFTLISCSIAHNTDYGAHIVGGSTFNMFGGTVDFNGGSGGTGFGIQLEDCGYQGGIGANIQGTQFEWNNGVADLVLYNHTVPAGPYLKIVHRVGADFKRVDDTTKTTNLILCSFGADATVGHAQLVLTGSAFKDYPGYTPNAATKYIAYSVTPANINNFFDYGSYFDSATETPAWIRGNTNTTAVGNVGGGTDDLISYAMPAGTLTYARQGIRITAWGTTANNANAKTLVLNFGSTAIQTNALTASVAGIWKIVAEVFSTGVDAQTYFSMLTTTGTAGVALIDPEQGTATEDDGATITIKCTGAATTDNDIIQKGLLVEFL